MRLVFRRTGLAASAFVLLALCVPASAKTITGRATIIDGDTLEIRGARIRLFGIDAPESGQICRDKDRLSYRCGREAAFVLADRIGSGTVSCEVYDRDRYGRSVAVCRQRGEDLNAYLVRQGWALAYRQFSYRYVMHELIARARGRGLWAGTFTRPWSWRRGKR